MRRSGSHFALAALLLALAGCDPSSWKGPEGQVRDAISGVRTARLGGLPGGAVLELSSLRHVEPAIDVAGGRAAVASMVDAEGRVEHGGGAVALRYLGRERFHLRGCAAGWCVEEDELARLRGVVSALLARERRDGEGRPVAWQIRVERDRAEVGEDRLSAAGAPSRALFQLVSQGDRWVLAAAP